MTLAEKLRENGAGKPDFTKEELMRRVEEMITSYGRASFTVGRHVGTDLKFCMATIGDCNPYNRRFLYKWLNEEGFSYSSKFNCYGVEKVIATV